MSLIIQSDSIRDPQVIARRIFPDAVSIRSCRGHVPNVGPGVIVEKPDGEFVRVAVRTYGDTSRGGQYDLAII